MTSDEPQAAADRAYKHSLTQQKIVVLLFGIVFGALSGLFFADGGRSLLATWYDRVVVVGLFAIIAVTTVYMLEQTRTLNASIAISGLFVKVVEARIALSNGTMSVYEVRQLLEADIAEALKRSKRSKALAALNMELSRQAQDLWDGA